MLLSQVFEGWEMSSSGQFRSLVKLKQSISYFTELFNCRQEVFILKGFHFGTPSFLTPFHSILTHWAASCQVLTISNLFYLQTANCHCIHMP